MHACKKGNMEVLKWLHHRGADVHKSDKHNHTALHIAVAQKQYACVEWLVDVAKLDTLHSIIVKNFTKNKKKLKIHFLL